MARRLLPLLLHHHHYPFIGNRAQAAHLQPPDFVRGFSPSRPPSSAAAVVDPGDWRFSPEWWGKQGPHGWGHNEGSVLFSRASSKSNGIVTVTSHPASSSPGLEEFPELLRSLSEGTEISISCEWRVLRFNNETRQSVAKVLLLKEHNAREPLLIQIPNCLAFECLKSMISVGLATLKCTGLDLDRVAQRKKQMRCLCIGLGGGSLPLFLANKIQGCNVEVVEIDKAVISAATEFMGFPRYAFKASEHDDCTSVSETRIGVSDRHGFWGSMLEQINGIEADGVAYVNALVKSISTMPNYYDIVFIDAFDGNNQVPSCFWSKGGSFLSDLNHLLHPRHGTVVVNLHTDAPSPSLVDRMRGEFGPGFDPHLPGGKQVLEISHLYRSSLIGHKAGCANGIAFTTVVPRQQNICLTIARGIHGTTTTSVIECLKRAACHLQHVLHVPFAMATRASRGLHFV